MHVYRRHVALIYNRVGQTVEFYPPTPALIAGGFTPGFGVTYSVWRGEDGLDLTTQFSGSATIDSLSTTTDAAAGPSQARRNRLPVTSTSSLALYRRFLVTNTSAAGGQRLVLAPQSIQSGDSVDVQTDIPIDLASGSSVAGIRCVFTVDTTFIQTAANINVFGNRVSLGPGTSGSTDTQAPPYKVRWVWADANGVTHEDWTTFDVCRAPAKTSVDKAMVLGLMPDVGFEEWLSQKGLEFQPQVKAAFDRVRWDIRMAGYDPDMLSMDAEVLDRLTLLATVALLAKLGCKPADRDPDAYASECEAEYQKALNSTVTVTLKAWAQTDASGAIALETSEQLWFHR